MPCLVGEGGMATGRDAATFGRFKVFAWLCMDSFCFAARPCDVAGAGGGFFGGVRGSGMGSWG